MPEPTKPTRPLRTPYDPVKVGKVPPTSMRLTPTLALFAVVDTAIDLRGCASGLADRVAMLQAHANAAPGVGLVAHRLANLVADLNTTLASLGALDARLTGTVDAPEAVERDGLGASGLDSGPETRTEGQGQQVADSDRAA